MKKIIIVLLLLSSINIYAQDLYYEPVVPDKDTLEISEFQIINGTKFFIYSGIPTMFVIMGSDTTVKIADDNSLIEGYRLTLNDFHIVSENEMFIYSWNIFGHPNHALLRYNIAEDSFTEFTTENSNLPSNNIFALATDENKRTMIISGKAELAFIEGDSIWTMPLSVDDIYRLPQFFNYEIATYFKGHFYYHAAWSDLIRVDKDSVKLFGKSNFSDYEDSDQVNIIINRYAIGRDKLWFSLVNGDYISFDGENFERHSFMKDLYGDNIEIEGNWIFFDRADNFWYQVKIYYPEDERIEYHLGMIDTLGNQKFDLEWGDTTVYNKFRTANGFVQDRYNLDDRKVYISFRDGLLIYDPDKTGVIDIGAIPSMIAAKVYPNPCKLTANIELYASWNAADNLKFRLCDYLGKVYDVPQPEKSYDRSTGELHCQIDLNGINPGYYYLLIEDGQFSICKPIIIE